MSKGNIHKQLLSLNYVQNKFIKILQKTIITWVFAIGNKGNKRNLFSIYIKL